jgi:O-antigen/teichoic acid export membrane protein
MSSRAYTALTSNIHPLLKNFSFLALGNLASKAVLFLVNAYLARIFSPEDFGRLILAQTVLLFGTIVADPGVRVLAVRNIAIHPAESRRPILQNTWTALVVLGGVALLASIAGASLFGDSRERTLILYYAGLLPLFTLNFDWILKGEQRFKEAGVAEALKAVFYFIPLVLLARQPEDLYLVPLAYGFGWLVAALYVFFRVRPRRSHLTLQVNSAHLKRLIVAAVPIGLSGIVVQSYQNSGIFFLNAFANSAAVGLYGAVLKLTLLFMVLGALFSETLLPTLAVRHAASEAAGRRLTTRLLFLRHSSPCWPAPLSRSYTVTPIPAPRPYSSFQSSSSFHSS